VQALLPALVHISITSINNTFDSLRYPATCQGLKLTGSTTGYTAGDAPSSFSKPLSVTKCSSLAYNPKFAVSAARDKNDKSVTLATTVSQTASEAPSRAVSLTFPTSFLGANINALGSFCANISAGCATVGSVTAASPLYPKALSGKAYLTGSTAGLTLTLVFPAPFPLTLVGRVNLAANSASFTGLPDIPLTSLAVTLSGGPKGLFATNCINPTGTATAGLTDQQGDRTRSVPARFSVSGCPAGSGCGTSSGSGSGSGSGTSSGHSGTASAGGAHLVANSVSGLAKGKPSLAFTVSSANKSAKLKRLTVKLPHGLRFVRHKVHRKLKVTGVHLKGAKAHSLKLSHGKLVITLRKPARKVTVKLGARSLKESSAMRAQARKKALKRLTLKVAVRNTKRKSHTLTVAVTKLHL
jgi:hypothetical protein